MSSTKRGGQRSEADNYPTPAWAVHRLLEKVHFKGGHWLEPGAGNGHIIRAVNEFRSDVIWSAIELRKEERPALVEACGSENRVHIANYMEDFKFPAGTPRFQLALGNPPFRLAMKFIEKSLEVADQVAMLLRLNFLGSQDRNEWMKLHPPDNYILPDRPQFRGEGTDSIEYSWMVWEEGMKPRMFGLLRLLDCTPLETRKAQKPTPPPKEEKEVDLEAAAEFAEHVAQELAHEQE